MPQFPEMNRTVGVVGFGMIGQRWAAVFANVGLDVLCSDPGQGRWDAFEELRPSLDAEFDCLRDAGRRRGSVRFSTDLAVALEGAGFVQECAPERLDLKQTLLPQIEDCVGPDILIASSSSALLVSDMQTNCRYPERIVLGHPFNPAHLMPLVEIVGGARTHPEALERARAIYTSIGKK